MGAYKICKYVFITVFMHPLLYDGVDLVLHRGPRLLSPVALCLIIHSNCALFKGWPVALISALISSFTPNSTMTVMPMRKLGNV